MIKIVKIRTDGRFIVHTQQQKPSTGPRVGHSWSFAITVVIVEVRCSSHFGLSNFGSRCIE